MTNDTPSENFGTVPNEASENLKIFPNHSETNFVPIRKPSERKPTHTLTVREVQRIFEDNEISLSEHTVINWCKQNSQGICKLDGFYDEAERRWYITPESVEIAIREERLKLRKDTPNLSEAAQNFSEAFGNVRNNVSGNFGTVPNEPSEGFRSVPKTSENNFGKEEKPEAEPQKEQPENSTHSESEGESARRIRELETKLRAARREITTLQIETKVKDRMLEEMDKQHSKLIDAIKETSFDLGDAKRQLLQLSDGTRSASNPIAPQPRVYDARPLSGEETPGAV
jgi:hypothetical protein